MTIDHDDLMNLANQQYCRTHAAACWTRNAGDYWGRETGRTCDQKDQEPASEDKGRMVAGGYRRTVLSVEESGITKA